jgi:hypothetical protein
MASVFPLTSYDTKHVSLTTTAKTTIYTAGDQQELAFDVTGLSATASDGTADTVTFIHYTVVDATEYVLVFRGPVETDYPLQLEGLPIHMVPGDIIKATSTLATGSHPTHIHLSGIKTTRTPEAAKK